MIDDGHWIDQPAGADPRLRGTSAARRAIAVVCAVRKGIGDRVLAGSPALETAESATSDARVAPPKRGPRARWTQPSAITSWRSATAIPLALLGAAPDLGGTPASPSASECRRLGRSRAASSRATGERIGPLPSGHRAAGADAAVEPVGDAALLYPRAGVLGVEPAAADAAGTPGAASTVAGTGRVRRSAHAMATYRAATADERRRVHARWRRATEALPTPSERAWHRPEPRRGRTRRWRRSWWTGPTGRNRAADSRRWPPS